MGSVAEPAAQRGRKQDQAGGEDRRDHPGHVELQRQVSGLRRIHAPPLLPLGIVDRNPPLAALNEHHAAGHHHRQHQQEQDQHDMQLTGARQFQRPTDRMRQAGDDAREDQHGDAIADATLGHLLAQPHQEQRSRDQTDGGDHNETNARRDHHRAAASHLALQGHADADSLKGRQ